MRRTSCDRSHQSGADQRRPPLLPERRSALYDDALLLQRAEVHAPEVEGLVVPRAEDGQGAQAGAALPVVLQAIAIAPVHEGRAQGVALDAQTMSLLDAARSDDAEGSGHLRKAGVVTGDVLQRDAGLVGAEVARLRAEQLEELRVLLAFSVCRPLLALRGLILATFGARRLELAAHAGEVPELARVLVQKTVGVAAHGVGARAEVLRVALVPPRRPADLASAIGALRAARRRRVPMLPCLPHGTLLRPLA
mmetsp:Transcript_11379/g.32793  ORF Transcript_11379/g.32793 Transcript_11379/m.32793 type:complete len:251 (-) Transcript_11379:418-1170(-)